MVWRYLCRSCHWSLPLPALTENHDIAVEPYLKAGVDDIVGIRLGMPLRDAVDEMKTHNLRGRQHPSGFVAGPGMIRKTVNN